MKEFESPKRILICLLITMHVYPNYAESYQALPYRASSLQYTMQKGEDPSSPSAVLSANLDAYESYIRNVASDGSQIVIFPEGTTGYDNAWETLGYVFIWI